MRARRGSPRLDAFGNHLDSSAGTFLHADAAALAEVAVKLVALHRTEFDDRVVRTHAKAVVALEAVPTREAAPGFEEGVAFVQSPDDLFKVGLATDPLEFWACRSGGVGVVPGVETIKGREFVALGWHTDTSEDVIVDAARGALSVAHRDGRGAIGRHGVAAREHATQ